MGMLKTGLPKFAPDVEDPQVVKVWEIGLEGVSDDKLRAAFRRAMQTLDAFPSPALIRRFAMGAEAGVEIAAKIEQVLYRLGSSGFPNYNLQQKELGPVAWEVVQRCGGWERICRIGSDRDVAFERKQWVEVADSVASQIAAGNLQIGHSDMPPEVKKLLDRVAEDG